ncbi:MAG: NAD(P)-dependent oxidoreductase [Methyloligellaceae bacterium]
MIKTAWIGLGVMGFPMAGYLSKSDNYEVCVYNRTQEKAQKWTEQYGGTKADTPALAVEDADYVFCCVGNDDDLRQVTLGENGAFANLKSGAVFVDHTTSSAAIARELYQEAKERGAEFLDAPVSGGQAGAENGQLTVMTGGNEAVFNKALPLIELYSRSVKLIGPSGSGQLAKMVNQICIAGLVQGLSEAIHFAEKADLDISAVMETISKGAAQSWQMENRWETMMKHEFDFGFAIDWMRKDLGFCLDEARRNGANLPVTALVDQFYSEMQAQGAGRWDTSCLIERLGPTEKTKS